MTFNLYVIKNGVVVAIIPFLLETHAQEAIKEFDKLMRSDPDFSNSYLFIHQSTDSAEKLICRLKKGGVI